MSDLDKLEKLSGEAILEELRDEESLASFLKGKEIEVRADWGIVRKGDCLRVVEQKLQLAKLRSAVTFSVNGVGLAKSGWPPFLQKLREGALHFRVNHGYDSKWLFQFFEEDSNG